jgi:hypothetical protein
MREFASMRTLDLWYARIDVDELLREVMGSLSRAQRKRGERNLAKTRAKDSLRAFAKLTELTDGKPRIVSDPPLIVPVEDLAGAERQQEVHEALHGLIRAYRRTLAGDRRRLLEQFRYVDAARKVVGVGSVGTRAWIILLLGRDNDDPLFLQAKEAQASVLEPHLGKSHFGNHGQRVVEGQQMMQAASDIMLGWLHTTGLDDQERDFYVRQLWDAKGSVLVDEIEPPLMKTYARVCGWALARAHARSGDTIAIASYLGSSDVFDRSLTDFASAYADQNELDHMALQQAVDTRRVQAETGL